MNDETPPGLGGASDVHGGEHGNPTTPPENRKVLSLADARLRKKERERREAIRSRLVQDSLAAFDDDPRPAA